MAKAVNFNFEGTDYTLEFNRRTVKEMEGNGFVAADIVNKPLTVLPKLFEGAFKMHHPTVKKDVINRIYAQMTNKRDLIACLAELYNEPINALIDEPEANEGNVIWTANWAYKEDKDED